MLITGCGKTPSASIPVGEESAAKPAETPATVSQPTLVKPLPISDFLQASPADDELGFMKDPPPRVARLPEDELLRPLLPDLLPVPSTVESFGP